MTLLISFFLITTVTTISIIAFHQKQKKRVYFKGLKERPTLQSELLDLIDENELDYQMEKISEDEFLKRERELQIQFIKSSEK